MSPKRTHFVLNVLIFILLLLAFILGYFISQELRAGVNIEEKLKAKPQIEQNPLQIAPPTSVTKSIVPESELKNYSKEELLEKAKEVSTTTNDSFRVNSALINAAAVDTNQINISTCVGDPYVIRVRLGENITVTNNADSLRSLELGGSVLVEVPPYTQKNVEADFEHGEGIYMYSCNEFSPEGDSGGLIMIVPS